MSKRGDPEYLKDILEAIYRIQTFIQGLDQEELLNDLKTQDAVLRNLEIIGEAVKNISPKLKEKYSDTDWKKIGGMRDKIIHLYFGVNWDIVLDVVYNKLPKLEKNIESCLKDLEG